MKDEKIYRGDIYLANLNPYKGSEQGGKRPVIIIQNDVGNHYSPTVIVTAVTSRFFKNYYDQMGTLVERSASTSGDTDLYDREIKKLCDKIEALRETLKTEQSKSVMTEDVKASIDRILGYLSKTDERSFLTYDDVTIRRLVECIVVHPEGKISVTLKGGFRGEETI